MYRAGGHRQRRQARAGEPCLAVADHHDLDRLAPGHRNEPQRDRAIAGPEAARERAGVPRTGQAHYSVGLLGAFSEPGAVTGITGSGSFQVDFVSGRLLGAVAIGADGGPTGNWQGGGTLSSSSNAFSGSFAATIGSGFNTFVGSFAGAFFGPAADELGLAFHGGSSSGAITVGTITGRNAATGSNADLNHLVNPQFFAATTGHVEFDNAGVANPATGVTASASTLILGYRPAVTFTGAGFNFFTPARAVALRTTADQYGIDGSNGYAGLGFGTYNSAGGWIQYNDNSLNYVKAGRLVTVNGTHMVFDDFVIGMPTAASAVPTGSAGYVLSLRGSLFDPAAAPIGITGGGTLTINFATGAITATGDVRNPYNYNLIGGFTGTSTLGSGSSAFSGSWNVAGAKAYTGSWSGGLFGPAADEIGARFQANAGDGSLMTGTLYGPRNDSVVASVPKLADLTAATTLRGALGFTYGQLGGDGLNVIYNQDPFIAVDYDPASGTYTLRSESTFNLGAPRIALTFDRAHIDAARSDDSFVAYRSADGNAEARILRFSGDNREVELTYSNVALITDRNPDGTGPGARVSRYYASYGLITPELQMPRSGSASYGGRAWGSGYVAGIGDNSAVTGTMNAQVNFGASSIQILLDLLASDPNGVLPSRNLGNFTFETGGGNYFSGGVNQNPYSYTVNGKFYGPNAAEIGGAFNLSKDSPTGGYYPDFKISGVFAGTKR